MEILSEEIFGIYTPMGSGVSEKRGDRVVVGERSGSNHPRFGGELERLSSPYTIAVPVN